MMTIARGAGRGLQQRTIFGVLLMMIGLALYPISDAFIKHLMETYGLFQSTFLRALTRLLPLFLATFFQGGPRAVFEMKQPKAHIMRLAVSLLYTYIFMYAYSKESLTVVYTLSYTSPFFLIVLSGLILKERITKERWIAVVIGAAGILVAIRPGFAPFEMTVLLVLFGVFLGTLNKILMRKLAMTEHGLAITIYPNLLLILATLPLLIGNWQAMPWSHWGLFSLVGILSAAGQYAIAQSLRFTEASILAPVDNSTFFWVVLLDFWGWGLVPDSCTLVGVAIIVGSNLYLLRQQRRILV
ncbi:MAG: DMT family transporter [Chlamydiota bacterium]